MRNICKFTGADVTGLTLNQYQVDRGNELCEADPQLGTEKCRSVQGDFMKMPFKDSSYDAAYAIEATCHAPDRVGVYSEIYRVLKPGSVFACYEWCMTDEYDSNNEEHRRIKKQIEEGDGLPDICHTSVCLNALKEAGFEVLDARDMADDDYDDMADDGYDDMADDEMADDGYDEMADDDMVASQPEAAGEDCDAVKDRNELRLDIEGPAAVIVNDVARPGDECDFRMLYIDGMSRGVNSNGIVQLSITCDNPDDVEVALSGPGGFDYRHGANNGKRYECGDTWTESVNYQSDKVFFTVYIRPLRETGASSYQVVALPAPT